MLITKCETDDYIGYHDAKLSMIRNDTPTILFELVHLLGNYHITHGRYYIEYKDNSIEKEYLFKNREYGLIVITRNNKQIFHYVMNNDK